MTDRSRWEQRMVLVALILVLAATGADLYEDWQGGNSAWALLVDLSFSGFVVGTLLYILIQKPIATLERNQYLERAIRHSHADLAVWKSRASELLQGLGRKIDEQFDYWHLSRAEKEVALLLIKGISLKELADIRGTSERTVRQQASSIYAKAGVESRAALAAFFLEDLLLPDLVR